MSSATFRRHAAGALPGTSATFQLPMPHGATIPMTTQNTNFDHLRAEHASPASHPLGMPFAHLLGRPRALTSATPISVNAAAIIAAGEHARCAQEGGK